MPPLWSEHRPAPGLAVGSRRGGSARPARHDPPDGRRGRRPRRPGSHPQERGRCRLAVRRPRRQSQGSPAGRPRAALTFYWPLQERQVRVRGTVESASAEQSAADPLARSPFRAR
ncbi:pyridoxamine 5'-phosphate oxidase family protein [Streptomyces sp. NPDC058619]|uniref:pyridoxamine 5'-phosphate oxidase family protein n=1 Tax=unclassified Streptomyces TaxID=2593676 RepID=UPI00365F962E